MKKFVLQLLYFSIIPVIYFGTVHLINRAIYLEESVDLQNARLLIVGDSHSMNSLNPNKFESALNISQAAEPYFITFWKLKKIFETNQVDSILLGFAPHNISAYNDYRFTDSEWSERMFKRTYPIENYRSLEDKIGIDYSTYFKVLFRETFFYPKKNHINYIGKFKKSKISSVSDWEGPVERHFYRNGKELGVSNTSIQYLDSIVILCKNNDIFLSLINSPVHNSYFNNIPISFLEQYNKLKMNYIKEDIFLLDKAKCEYPDTFFFNPDHTNFYGAEKFTNEVIEILSTRNQQNAKSQ